MAESRFVYVTYIRSTPERVWQGLTDPEFTARYWGRTFETDWKKGSRYAVTQFGVRSEDPEQVVLEADPPRRLSYTWDVMGPELAAAIRLSDDVAARMAAEPRSKVTFEIEPQDDGTVRLTVVHDGFEEGSVMLEGVSDGWPRVLANLKSLLETGEATSLWPSS
jgi:uncharacterized protein YndB with AHSA1/START domain